MVCLSLAETRAQRQMERLGRGLVAIHRADGGAYVGWRLLGTDPDGIAFNVYRAAGGGRPVRLNEAPITSSTNFVDARADLSQPNAWFVRPILDGREQAASVPFTLKGAASARPYIALPLKTPAGCTPNDASAGDLDGDGEYEIVLKQEMRPRDNSHSGATGQTKLEAYRLDGKLLWRIDLGPNVREGAHYTPFIVYDLDGDGRAEIACRTADGTVDGVGKVIGDAKADHRDARGYVLTGPEFLTIFDGRTGAALATVDYLPPRGRVRDWGDDYGNRVDRFLACVAYVDGKRPSLVMCRGYYARTVLVAWNWRGGRLTTAWTFDSADGRGGNRGYGGQGNHSLCVGDVDGDGRDEIIYGACAIDHNGKGLYTTGLGHGDALHLSDIDPDRPGLEVFGIHERPRHAHGANLRDAATGKVIWGLRSPDVGRGLAMDIDPRHKGYECWASGEGLGGLYNCKGRKVSDAKPRSCNMGVWWDDDVLREILDGTTISKWDHLAGRQVRLLSAYGCARNNGTKSNPCLSADLLGDWREEVVWRTRDNRELRIYTTTIPARRRLYTFMHDPVYRLSVVWQNAGYNQPTQPGFYVGSDMPAPPRPKIVTAGKCPAEKVVIGGHDIAEILAMLGAKRDVGATDDQVRSYASHFGRSDRNRDGKHTWAEYVEGGSYMTPQARAGIFGAADNNADGVVTRVEYVLNRIITDEAKTIVQRTDADNNGKVTRDEFVKGSPIEDKALAGAVYDALDTSGDGVITIPEYLRVWGGWARPNYKAQEAALAGRLAKLGKGGKPDKGGRRTGGARRAEPGRVDTFNAILGTQTIGVRYGFTEKTRLVETAERIREMGSNILKISMTRKYSGPDYALPQRNEIRSLRDLASKEPSFKAVLDMPFAYYHIWAYCFSSGWWADGVSDDERKKEHAEMYALATYLLERYEGTGKTFLIGHWEGDWHLHPGYDAKRDPSDVAIQGMIDWLNVRQKAIDDAKRDLPAKGVRLYHYTEANLAQKAIKGRKCLTNDVLPHTTVDYVSYSSYDTIHPHAGNVREALHKALDHIESKLPDKPGLSGKRVFIGEYGFPLVNTKTPARQDALARDVCRAALEWGCPFVLYWEMYCNENQTGRHRGFWLIDDKNRKQPFYFTLQTYYAKSRTFVASFRKQHGRLPTDAEYRTQALRWLASPGGPSSSRAR